VTNKKYLTIAHILSKYFELAFLQLHLVKFLCKLIIIWVNYEKKKKGAFFMKPHVYHTANLLNAPHNLCGKLLAGKEDQNIFYSGIQALEKRGIKCISAAKGYVEKSQGMIWVFFASVY